MTAPKPPDVDALARRLPRRDPPPEQSAALRRALLDAAGAPGVRRTGAPRRTWVIGGGLAIAAAACVALALRALVPAHPESPQVIAASTATVAAEPPSPRDPGGPARASGAPFAATAVPDAPGDALPDGVSAIRATRPMQVSRGDTSITAPPGAQFDVDVQGDQVRHVTVRSGWVVVAGARTAATVIVERQTWFPAAPPGPAPAAAPGPAPAIPVPAAGPAAPATVPSGPPSSTAPPVPHSAAAPATSSGPPSPAAPPRPPPALAASRSPSDGTPDRAAPPTAAPDRASPAPAAPEPAAGPIDAAAQQAVAAEQAFHDGLRALLAGQARAATGPLDRACGMPSTSQDDICYWAAVAWLRAGDRGRARQALSDVLARWPGSTHAGEASVALGWLLLDAGDRAAARARFAAAVNDRMPGVRAEATHGLAAAQ